MEPSSAELVTRQYPGRNAVTKSAICAVQLLVTGISLKVMMSGSRYCIWRPMACTCHILVLQLVRPLPCTLYVRYEKAGGAVQQTLKAAASLMVEPAALVTGTT